MTNGGPGHATELLITYIYKSGFGQTKFDYAAALTVVQFIAAAGADLSRQPRRRRQCRRAGAAVSAMRQRATLLRHAALVGDLGDHAAARSTGCSRPRSPNENIYAYPPRLLPENPHLFNFVDVWYLIPFPRYLLNSLIVSALVVAVQRRLQRHGRLRADQELSGQARDPAAVPLLHADPVPGHHHPGLPDHRPSSGCSTPISASPSRCSPPSCASSCSRPPSRRCRTRSSTRRGSTA